MPNTIGPNMQNQVLSLDTYACAFFLDQMNVQFQYVCYIQ